MKKIALAVAMVLTLSMLASCKFETTSKDVTSTYNVGTVAGKVTVENTTKVTPGTKDADGKFVPTTGADTEIRTNENVTEPTLYSVSYKNDVNANYTTYIFSLFDKDYVTIGSLTLTKIGDKYYSGREDVTAYVSDSPDGNFAYTYASTKEESIYWNQYGFETKDAGDVASKVVKTNKVTYSLTFTVAE